MVVSCGRKGTASRAQCQEKSFFSCIVETQPTFAELNEAAVLQNKYNGKKKDIFPPEQCYMAKQMLHRMEKKANFGAFNHYSPG